MLLATIVTVARAGRAGQTYYVRTDGGTSSECTGLVDAAYPGSGAGQACALSHPFWALTADGLWHIAGGATLLIGEGSYQIGWGAPNTGWYSAEGAYGCVLPTVPSGSPGSPTRILGRGWASGCSRRPELWGTERAAQVLDLTGSSDVVVDCLEITDHSSCAVGHCNASVRRVRSAAPYGAYADYGILASASARVVLRNLDVHGLADAGIVAAGLTDWTVEDVRLAGNAGAGWSGDVGTGSSCSGTLTFRRLLVEWNGCPETHPGRQPDHCWGQVTCGGYGDGVGFARTGGRWVVEDSVFRHNVSDGLDLLYVGVDHPEATVEVRRCQAYGNAGNQLKLGGISRVVNSLAVSDCAFFLGKPYGQEMGPMSSGDHCRAGGAAVAFFLPSGGSSSLVNSTVASQGWTLVETSCNTADFPDQKPCTGAERTTLANNVFRGYQVVYLDYARPTDFVGDGDPAGFTTAEGVDYNVIFGAEVSSPVGPHTLTTDPKLRDDTLASFDGRLRPESPAVDSGLPVGSLGGLVPADDLLGVSRPAGAGVDRGAYEYLSSGSCSVACSATVPAAGTTGSPIAFSATAQADGCAGAPAFDWDFGDGSSHGSASSVTHVYAAPGLYAWRLAASASGVSCSRTGTLLVTGSPANVSLVPSVAHSPGLEGSLWRTDVVAVNRASAAAALTLTFVPTSGAPRTATSSVPPNGTREWPDVLVSAFGFAGSASISGALHVASDQPLAVSSRTYSEGGTGTFGGSLAGVASASSLSPGTVGILPQLRKSARYRTNVGLANAEGASVNVGIRLRDASGTHLGRELLVSVPPAGFLQVTDVFAACGAGEPSLAYAALGVKTPGGRVAAFASVIDNDTNDPTIHPLSLP